jgi:hypothetical protein
LTRSSLIQSIGPTRSCTNMDYYFRNGFGTNF